MLGFEASLVDVGVIVLSEIFSDVFREVRSLFALEIEFCIDLVHGATGILAG